jgi:hypothetical protein
MAKYIPPGVEYVAGVMEIIGTMIITDPGKMLNSPRLLDDRGIFVQSITVSEIAAQISQQWVSFIISGELTKEKENILNGLSNCVKINYNRSYDTYQHNGFIERDIIKHHAISETKRARIWDIPEDEDGNKWEVSILESSSYFCCECNDTHWQWFPKQTYLFNHQKDAEEKYIELCNEPIIK